MANFYYNLQGGLNTQLTPVKLGAESGKVYWTEGINVEPYKNQGVTRQKGNQIILDISKKIDGAAGGPSGDVLVIGAVEYPKGSKNLVIGLSDGRVFCFDRNLGTLKPVFDFNENENRAESLSKSGNEAIFPLSKFLFEYFLDGLVIIPQSSAPKAFKGFLDGIYYNPGFKNPVAALNLPKVDREVISVDSVCQYAGRLWVSSDATLYYSALGTFDDWSSSHDAGYITNFHSSTAKITALSEYRGALAIYKAYEVFLLTGTDPESFAVTKFADKGTPGPGGVLTCNNKQYFFNDSGLFSLSYVGESAQIVMGSNLAKNISKMFEKIDRARVLETVMLPLEVKNQIWIFPPIQGETGEKEVWIFDWALDCWFIRVIPYEISTAASVSGNIYTATPNGPKDSGACIFCEDKGNTFSSKPIKFSFSTPFFNFSKPTTRKIIEDAQIICDGASENNFDFSISTDYVSKNVTEPENVRLDVPNTLVWAGLEDSADTPGAQNHWDTEDKGAIWADYVQEGLKLDIFEANRAVQLHFQGDAPGKDLTIIGIEFKGIIYEE